MIISDTKREYEFHLGNTPPFILILPISNRIRNMVQQKHDSAQKSINPGYGRLVETSKETRTEIDEKNIPAEYILEFISRHHLNRLWDEFIYEKNHPKIPLSVGDVLAMINLPPEEQERILKDHE